MRKPAAGRRLLAAEALPSTLTVPFKGVLCMLRKPERLVSTLMQALGGRPQSFSSILSLSSFQQHHLQGLGCLQSVQLSAPSHSHTSLHCNAAQSQQLAAGRETQVVLKGARRLPELPEWLSKWHQQQSFQEESPAQPVPDLPELLTGYVAYL